VGHRPRAADRLRRAARREEYVMTALEPIDANAQLAHAKVILFGEHAVVHGRLAIAAALDRGARAVATRSEGRSVLDLAPWGRTARVGDDDDDVSRAFAALLDRAGAGTTGVSARVQVDVPGGAGLGCSAAIAVAVARAVGVAIGKRLDADGAAECAMAWERVFHGNPSGVDVAVSARGGVVSFRRGSAPQPIQFPDAIELAVASTGEPCSTRAMVEQVGRQLARRPQVVERTFDGIDTLSVKGLEAIKTGRWYEVGRLMDLNHALLASLMVSTERLEAACNIARGAGAFGAKLTGGGGGGCAIALAPGKTHQVVEAWKREGIDGFVARIPPPLVVVSAFAP
ncbi:MAG: mevalonate kinase, partial [Polyangiales bacterium]